jgi:hypothetical protein
MQDFVLSLRIIAWGTIVCALTLAVMLGPDESWGFAPADTPVSHTYGSPVHDLRSTP